MRELVSSTIKQKPIIALVDPDSSRGGMSSDEVLKELIEAEGCYAKWQFDVEMTPLSQALYNHLFASEPIEWNRARTHSSSPAPTRQLPN